MVKKWAIIATAANMKNIAKNTEDQMHIKESKRVRKLRRQRENLYNRPGGRGGNLRHGVAPKFNGPGTEKVEDDLSVIQRLKMRFGLR